jgi:glycerophosphoryl diester phosphodiesterase
MGRAFSRGGCSASATPTSARCNRSTTGRGVPERTNNPPQMNTDCSSGRPASVFRNEQYRLASDFKTNPVNEFVKFYELGVDGLFTDFTDTAHVARFTWQLKTNPELAECLKGEKRGKQCAAWAD